MTPSVHRVPSGGRDALRVAGIAAVLFLVVLALLYLLTGAGFLLLTLVSGL